MPNLNAKFKKILTELDQKIQNKEDLKYIKVQIFNLYNIFFEEVEKIEEMAGERITQLMKAQEMLLQRIEKAEGEISNIEKDIYADDDCDFAITCPYCSNEFVLETEELKTEVKCPECNNIIELNWGEDCEHGCCDHDCSDCSKEDDDM